VRTRQAVVREARKHGDDRGAVLFILVLFLAIFLAVATLAVDLAALGARGQDLQTTSDAAALAGVVEYQEHILAGASTSVAENAARVVVESVMEQNGIDASAGTIEVELAVSADGSRLQVRIVDNDPDRFLPNGLFGETLKPGDASITRSATAEFLACENECSLAVQIEKSFGAVNARGDGDGYKPILVSQKLYAINHNSSDRNIVCISTITQEPCWPDGVQRSAYSNGVGFRSRNPEMPHTAIVGSRIYWAATDENNGHRLFCWETASGLDVPCNNAVTLNSGLRRFDEGAPDNRLTNDKDENRGGGTFTVFGEKVFSFTDDHRIHCWDPAINAICGGYSNGGNSTSLAVFPASSPVDGNHGSSIDRIVDKTTGYVYSTLHIPYAQNLDCASALANPAGERVIVQNERTGRYLATDFPDSVYTSDTGADERMWWDVENFGPDTLSLQSVNHGEFLDASGFATTSFARGEDHRWNSVIDGDAYFINSDNLDFAAGSLFDDDGGIIEELDPPSSPNARWNFYPWECGIDPNRVDPAPDYFVDGTWLHCYDTGAVSGLPRPCPDFTVSGVSGAPAGTPTPIHADGTRFSGRLWFYYGQSSDDGEPTKLGVCSSGYSTWNDPYSDKDGADDLDMDPFSVEINCVSISDGDFDSSLTSDMNPVRDTIRAYTTHNPGAWGDPHWNSTENRLFYPTDHDKPRIICFDFDTRFTCAGESDVTGMVPPNPTGITVTEDYGFVSEGDCVYALGHNAFFWAFKASDLGEPCDPRIPPIRVERCPCGDGQTFRWGELDFREVDLSRFEVFGVRIKTDDGGDGSSSLPIFPAGGTYLSIKPGGASQRIPLDDLAIADGAESILVEFDVEGLDEDAIEDIGNFEIRFSQRPKLVD